jgi:hypothetical protein
MHRAKQEIFSVDVIDVYRIAVTPACGPWLHDYKPISTVLKALRSFNYYGLANGERMLPAEVRAETVVGNAAALPALRLLIVALILTGLLLAIPVVSIVVAVLVGLPVGGSGVVVLLLIFVYFSVCFLASIPLCAFIVLSI